MTELKKLDSPEVRYRQVPQWKDGKKYSARRLEVQNYTTFMEAINLGAAFAIGFWFVSAIPLVILALIIAALL